MSACLLRLAACCLALLLGACSLIPSRPKAGMPAVRHYALELTPSPATQSVEGLLTLTVETDFPAGALRLNAHAMQVEAVSEAGRPLDFSLAPGFLTIALPPEASGSPRKISIRYRAVPARGMLFLEKRPQIYTAFSTAHWMPCDEQPAARATLELSLTLPRAWKVAASGEWLEDQEAGPGMRRTTWRLDEPHACYLFGFVAGEFREVIDDAARPRLRFLVPPAMTEEAARQVFAETRSMIRFYEDRAGFRYPAPTYTQAIVGGAAAQEMAGIALFSEQYAQRVLANPESVWLGAHELSHQWWGNRITNASWNHFWLNEGVASFMNAAWLESRYGPAAYARQLDATRQAYHRVVSAGRDKPLIFKDWSAPTAEDRSLVYDKGALALVRLREILGETDFWAGIRLYSRRHRGEAVVTADLQRAMEDASGRELGAWFRAWAYGPMADAPPTSPP